MITHAFVFFSLQVWPTGAGSTLPLPPQITEVPAKPDTDDKEEIPQDDNMDNVSTILRCSRSVK